MKKFLFGIILVFTVSIVLAGEKIDLSTPDQTSAGTTSYYIARLDMDWDASRVVIYLNSSTGLTRTLTFEGANATNYMKALNKRHATVTSNQKWTLEQLVSKGFLTGTVSGVAD
jgi:hypothetical protein